MKRWGSQVASLGIRGACEKMYVSLSMLVSKPARDVVEIVAPDQLAWPPAY